MFATDADTGDNAEISYYITKGDSFSHFFIRRTGEISVNKELDRERISEYDLEVSATDGAHVAICRVIVTGALVNKAIAISHVRSLEKM